MTAVRLCADGGPAGQDDTTKAEVETDVKSILAVWPRSRRRNEGNCNDST